MAAAPPPGSLDYPCHFLFPLLRKERLSHGLRVTCKAATACREQLPSLSRQPIIALVGKESPFECSKGLLRFKGEGWKSVFDCRPDPSSASRVAAEHAPFTFASLYNRLSGAELRCVGRGLQHSPVPRWVCGLCVRFVRRRTNVEEELEG